MKSSKLHIFHFQGLKLHEDSWNLNIRKSLWITRADFYAIVYFYQNNKLACFTFQQRMTTALLFKVWWKTEFFLMDAMCVLLFFWHISLLFLWRSLANVEFFCVLEVDHEHLVKDWNEWNNFRTYLFSSSPFFSTLKSSNGLEELTFHNR